MTTGPVDVTSKRCCCKTSGVEDTVMEVVCLIQRSLSLFPTADFYFGGLCVDGDFGLALDGYLNVGQVSSDGCT